MTSRFILFPSGVKYISQGSLTWGIDPIWAVSLHGGYTPNTASHSTFSQVSPFRSSANGALVAMRQLSSVNLTGSGASTVKFTASNLRGFSATGSLFSSRFVAIFASSSADVFANPLIGFVDAESAVASKQLDVQWASSEVFNMTINP